MTLLITLGLIAAAAVVVWIRNTGRIRLPLACLFVIGVSWWWGVGYLKHQQLRIHTWEVFHHYLHAKYLPELRYRRMYQCVAEAAGETGRDIRDLVDNRYRSVSEIQVRDGLCRTVFTPDCWDHFEKDVLWFRAAIGPDRWAKVYFDHGANASPAWAAVARLFVSESSASESVIWRAAAADTVLLAALWALIWIAFGPVAATVTAILWSTCSLGGYTWTGGAFLRKDWLVAFALSIAALRRGWFLIAGLLAGYAGLVRIFPLAILGAAATLHWVLVPSERRSVLRCVVGATIVVMLGVAIPSLVFDTGVWSDFAANLAKHRATNAGNVVGLPQILENVLLCRYGPYGDPAGGCALPEQRPFETADLMIAGLRIAIAAMVVAVVPWRFRAEPLWLKAVVLIGTLPLCVDAASYDMEVMALLGLATCSLVPAASIVLLAGWAIMSVSATFLSSAPGNTIWTILAVELVFTIGIWFVYAERRSEETLSAK